MADLTPKQLSALNALLLPLDKCVRTEVRGGVTVYWLYRLTPTEEIANITSFAAIYGV
jgi:hypothetical protein